MEKKEIKKGILVNMIECQEGAIVSKTLIEENGGTVTLFALGKGESISEHSASHQALAQVLEGKIEFTISGKKETVKAGEIIIMPAEEPHGLRAEASSKMILTMIE